MKIMFALFIPLIRNTKVASHTMLTSSGLPCSKRDYHLAFAMSTCLIPPTRSSYLSPPCIYYSLFQEML